MNKKNILLTVWFLVFLYSPIDAAAEGYKVSGNGYNYQGENGEMASLGLNVTSSPLWGWLRYYYPNMNLISTSITGVTVNGDSVTITGTGTVQANSGYTFTATIIAGNPDSIGIEVHNSDGSLYNRVELKAIVQGNFDISTQ
ncbi:MAG: hypothetical protein HY808_00640 [Nitrospirae bacterium]|nr:hypothetical protein [Nitrospirota bacterium]